MQKKKKTMHMVLKIAQKSYLSVVVGWKQKDRPLPVHPQMGLCILSDLNVCHTIHLWVIMKAHKYYIWVTNKI